MREEFRKSLILSVISFSKKVKLQLDEEENYIAIGEGLNVKIDNSDSAMKEIFEYIYLNELGENFKFTSDQDYYLAFINIVRHNINEIDHNQIISNSVMLDAINSEDKVLIVASTLIASMLESIPNSADKIENIMLEV